MTEATAYIGQPLRRREDLRLTTGKGRYVDDIKVPGAMHMAVLRSPHAHAIISRVDLAAASAAPGVRLALSGVYERMNQHEKALQIVESTIYCKSYIGNILYNGLLIVN